METYLLKTIVMLMLPASAFFAGAWLLEKISGRQQVPQKPLNQRLGYDISAVQEYWGSFDDNGRRAEKRFLELDLVFPFLYGGTLATSLLMAWSSMVQAYPLTWILIPVAITLLADWTENFVHLKQLKRYASGGQGALQESWIRVASTATFLKLSFFAASWLILLCLIVRLWMS
jgi:hypothetical protein